MTVGNKGLCICGPKGAIQIRYYYYYYKLESMGHMTVKTVRSYVVLSEYQHFIDQQTNRQADTSPIAKSHPSIAERNKKWFT